MCGAVAGPEVGEDLVHRSIDLEQRQRWAISAVTILRRYARDDLRPNAYSTITVRVIVAVLLGWLVKVVAPDWPQLGAALLVAAFLIGIVPETFLTFLQEVYRAKWLGRLTRDMEEAVPLNDLEGIDLYDRARGV